MVSDRPFRMTIPLELVLSALLDDPALPRYGVEIGVAAGLRSGTVHPILARLERAGWLASEWERIDTSEAGRPARRYYRLTAQGESSARAALAHATRPRTVRALRPLLGET